MRYLYCLILSLLCMSCKVKQATLFTKDNKEQHFTIKKYNLDKKRQKRLFDNWEQKHVFQNSTNNFSYENLEVPEHLKKIFDYCIYKDKEFTIYHNSALFNKRADEDNTMYIVHNDTGAIYYISYLITSSIYKIDKDFYLISRPFIQGNSRVFKIKDLTKLPKLDVTINELDDSFLQNINAIHTAWNTEGSDLFWEVSDHLLFDQSAISMYLKIKGEAYVVSSYLGFDYKKSETRLTTSYNRTHNRVKLFDKKYTGTGRLSVINNTYCITIFGSDRSDKYDYTSKIRIKDTVIVIGYSKEKD